MKIDVRGRWVWITGASSGLGTSMARALAARGARLVLSGRNREALGRVQAEAQTLSSSRGTEGGHEVLAFDLLDRGARAEAVDRVIQITASPALVVLNAGVSQRSRFEDLAPEAFDRIVELDFAAPVDLTRRLLPVLQRPSGLVLISSVAGLIGAPQRSAYSSAKHALAGFGAVLRGEVYDRGVAVTTAYPGYVRTGIDHAALGSDGRPKGVDDPHIRHGADPDRVAERIVRAALAGRAEVRVAFNFESYYALWAARHLPDLYARLAAARSR